MTSAPPNPDAQALQDRLSTAFAAQPLLTAAPDALADALRSNDMEAFAGASPLAACLLHILPAIGWRGGLRDIAESLPHFVDRLDLTDLLNMLARLGLRPSPVKTTLDQLPDSLLPCLIAGDAGQAYCVLERLPDGTYRAFDGASRTMIVCPPETLTGTIVALDRRLDIERPEPVQPDRWTARLALRFRDRLGLLFVQSAAINLCGLASPLIVMAIYDKIIPSKNLVSLAVLMLGVIGLMAVQARLQTLRSRVIAMIGARVEAIVATSTFSQILNLPIQMTETVPVGQQAARIREFDSLRDIFAGPLLTIALELPFLLLFLAAIWWIGGSLVWIPVAMMALYAVIGASLWPPLKRAVRGASKVRAKRHSAIIEMVTKLRAIKQLGAEHHWREQLKTLAANAAHTHLRMSDLQSLVQTFAQAVMTLAGIATLALGVFQVIEQTMTVGGLIAIMVLVWRVLAPLQNIFLTLGRLEQISLSLGQVNQLMRLPVEVSEPIKPRRVQRRLAGGIEFQRVSFRYAQSPDPALLAIGLRIQPGELIAMVGGNGAGKSTFLALLLGMQRPQAGQILLDGVDIRQVDPLELRRMIAYVPQRQSFFYGTIAQNLRLGHPTASDAELRAACARIGMLERIEKLPHGFETRIGDQTIAQINLGFLQGLSIARSLVKQSSILLLDEPAQGLDAAADQDLMALLKQLRGKVTVIMVTHRPSHLRLADKVAVMERGQLLAFGPPNEVLANQQRDMAS